MDAQLKAFLNAHPTPSFVIDLQGLPRVQSVYTNPAFSHFDTIERLLRDDADFGSWLGSSARSSNTYTTRTGAKFSAIQVTETWVVVMVDDEGGETANWLEAWSAEPERTEAEKEHARVLAQVAWEETSLGPLSSWSSSLRGVCSLMLNSPFPCALYWGTDLNIIYNSAYVSLVQQKHPQILSKPYKVAWQEIWNVVGESLENALSSGVAASKENDLLFIERAGFLEETYFDWSVVPIHIDGQHRGLLNPAFEQSKRVIAERRLKVLRELGQKTAHATSMDEFYEYVRQVLVSAQYDIPFAALYGPVSGQDTNAPSSDRVELEFKCGVGVSAQHSDVVPTRITLEGGSSSASMDEVENLMPIDDEGLTKSLFKLEDFARQVHLSGRTALINNRAGCWEDFEKRGWPGTVGSVALSPIRPSSERITQGILLSGINPRRPFDNDYSVFIELLSRQIAMGLTNVQLFEDEVLRAKQIAALDRQKGIELQQELEKRTNELRDSEGKFRRMAEVNPIGILIANEHRQLTFVNNTWHKITRYHGSLDNWWTCVHPEDLDLCRHYWYNVLFGGQQINFEFRIQSSQQDIQWVELVASPEYNRNNDIIGCFGALLDITLQKSAAAEQKQRLDEAVELKRQQEYFIDLTSHEMRNPLSAMMQSSDHALQCLDRLRKDAASKSMSLDVENALEAVNTIILCAQHQKRIIDDTLTMSKLDSNLLLVTPVSSQPLVTVQSTLKMFTVELATKGIAFEFETLPSYFALHVDWVMADPSRFAQVLMNLLTNAIKFTSNRPVRQIKVALGASITVPLDASQRDITKPSLVVSPDDSNVVYITFAVQDTGCGLSAEEKAVLFQRFSQAKPLTHVEYGGSGLGLFICRRLTELQGGQIYVESVENQGSIFSFYIRVVRTEPPAVDISHPLAMSDQLASPPKLEVAAKSSNAELKIPAHVLIVEDNLINQKVLKKQLTQAGCIVSVANHGLEALSIIKSSSLHRSNNPSAENIDICLMDVEMPIMDGLTACRHIREMETSGELSRHLPVIAVTANSRKQQIDNMRNSGEH